MSDNPEPPAGWKSHATAARFRDYVRSVVRAVLDEERPPMKFAVVESIDRDTGTCRVVYQGDTDPVTVSMFAMQPTAEGQAVIIDGPRTRRFISQVLGQTFIPGLATAGWLQIASAPVGRWGGFSASDGSVAFFGGGMDANGSGTSFVSYNVDLRMWSVEVDLPEPRARTGAAVIGSSVYVPGGEDGTDVFDTVLEYDTSSNTWIDTLSVMPITKSRCGVCTHGGLLYVFGGISSVDPSVTPSPEAFAYDPILDSWASLSDMPDDLIDAWAVAVNDSIFIFGVDASDGTNRFYEYDTIGDSYTEILGFPDMLAGVGVTAFQDRVVVSGGSDVLSSTGSAKVYLYDPPSGNWTTVDHLPVGTAFGSAEGCTTKIVYVGGIVPDNPEVPCSTAFTYTPS